MKTKTIWPMAVLAGLTITSGCGGGSGGGNEILATVQGEPINFDQFNKYLAIKPTVRVIVQGQTVELPVADTLAFQAMQDLVSRTTLMQMAKDEGVLPTDAEIDKEIAFQKELDPNFLTAYQRRGLIIDQIRDEVKFSLVQERLITKGINIKPEEVDEWLKKNPDATLMPESADLSWILASTDQRKNEADAALKNGEKFSEVAKKLSQAPNAAIVNGRYLPERGPIPVNKMAENLRTEIVKTAVGSDTQWIKFAEGWAKFHVDNKNEQKRIEITPARRENIRRNIALQEGNKANDLRKKLVERIRNSDIKVRPESLKDAWKNFAELLQKQADQATAPGSASVQPDAAGAAPATNGSTTGN